MVTSKEGGMIYLEFRVFLLSVNEVENDVKCARQNE